MAYTAQKVVSILFVLMIILLPMGWILIANEPTGPYYPTENNKVEAFLQATGLSICEKSDSTWNVIGATGGFSVFVAKECPVKDFSSGAYIHVQNFDSEQTRDSAVKYIQTSVDRLDINGAVYTYGSYVIAVQGPTGGKPITETISQVKAALKK